MQSITDPWVKGLRGEIREALRDADMMRYRDLCLIYAGYLEEDLGRDDLAERRRRKGETLRAHGIRWPSPWAIQKIDDDQRAELAKATSRRVGVLAGTPGTGKTHCVAALVNAIMSDQRTTRPLVALCAPTGKAAVRMSAAFSLQSNAGTVMPAFARTIHSLLEISRNGYDGQGWRFLRNASRPLDVDFVIVDEASMLDMHLANCLLDACRPGTHVLFVGDPYQLPPVGPGAPFRDMIASGEVGTGQLTQIRRNAGAIVKACASIKAGTMFPLTSPGYGRTVEDNLTFIHADTIPDMVRTLRGIYQHPTHREDDIQTITPVNKGSLVARAALNTEIQQVVNIESANGQSPYWENDRVICLRNGEYDADPMRGSHEALVYVANGEMGTVLEVSPRYAYVQFDTPARVVQVPYKVPTDDAANKDGEDLMAIESTGDIVSCFTLGYAITCHKSQGSQWPVIIVMLDPTRAAEMVTTREWLYTAISRASSRCYLIGAAATMQKMIRKTEAGQRRTRLAGLLKEKE